MAKDAELTTLRNLHEKLAELRQHEQEILDEMGRLLNGELGIGAILRRLEEHYSMLWSVRYSQPYVWAFAKDRPHLKRLIKSLGVEQLELRMGSYLKNPDPFYVKAKHSFAVFVASINTHAVAESSRQRDEPCQHEPRCPGTWQHYRLLEAEASGDEALIATCRKYNTVQA